MLVLEKEQTKRILITELGYTSSEADSYLHDYPPIHDELTDAVSRWLEDRTILDASVFGISISAVMRTRHTHFLMAISDLNRLLDIDLTPERRERLIEILRKPTIHW